MKGEFFTYDANGNVNGAETRYYNDDTDNTLAWKINNGGNREASLTQYWVQYQRARLQLLQLESQRELHQRYRYVHQFE